MSAFPKSRNSTACQNPASRAHGVRLDHGGVQQVLHILRGPYTRGEEVSRPVDDVIAEVAGLADRGVREVNLLGPERERLSRPEPPGRDRGFRGVTPSGESGAGH